MRSLLIAPADEKRLAEALKSGADAVIVDLAGAAPAERAAARAVAARFLKETRGKRGGPALIVRANALDFRRDRFRSRRSNGWRARRDPAAGEPGRRERPTAFRQACGARGRFFACRRGDADHRRRRHGPVYVRHGSLSRLERAANRHRLERGIVARRIGAETDHDHPGEYAGPYRLARDLTLLAATSARVAAIDTAFADLHDKEGLRAEALAARRAGFAGKMAIDPAQVDVINDVFPPR